MKKNDFIGELVGAIGTIILSAIVGIIKDGGNKKGQDKNNNNNDNNDNDNDNERDYFFDDDTNVFKDEMEL